jgi:hypothetical protein
MSPQVPPHLLAAWRALIEMLQVDAEGPRAEWEAFLRARDAKLLDSWRKYLRGAQHLDERLLAAWADIEVRGPWGRVRRELTPYDRPITYGPDPERPLYTLGLVKMDQARDWFSVLSVIDHQDWKVETHPVQVNSPLRYGGFRFFQATAATDRDGLGVSGISVTRNRGVWFMYVGYTVLTLGVCYIFFLRPVIDRRARKRRLAEVQAA